MNQKGLTLIELMFIVAIIGIIVAIVAGFTSSTGKYHKRADELIKQKVDFYSVTDKSLRGHLRHKIKEQFISIDAYQQRMGWEKEPIPEPVKDTAGAVVKEIVVLQQDNYTAPPVRISCQHGDFISKKCTMTFEQNDMAYIFPVSCERVDEKAYKCEVF